MSQTHCKSESVHTSRCVVGDSVEVQDSAYPKAKLCGGDPTEETIDVDNLDRIALSGYTRLSNK